MEGLMNAIFGKSFDFGKQGIMGAMGNEGFSNLLKGGMSLYNGMQMGDMLDFQKGLAKKADARTQSMFDRDNREQDALNNINFA